MTKLYDIANAIKNNQNLSNEERMEDLDYLISRFQKFTNYTNAVVMMNVTLKIIKMKELEKAEYQSKIMELDSNRRIMHDSAINACVQLDRLCKLYNLDPFCGIAVEKDSNGKITSDCRYKFAIFIGKIVNEIFNEEIMDKNHDIIRNISLEEIKNTEKKLIDLKEE